MSQKLLLFTVFLCIYYTNGQLYEQGDHKNKPNPSPLMKSCLDKTTIEQMQCVVSNAELWNITEILHKPPPLNPDLNTQNKMCCYSWDATKCIVGVSKSKCNSDEYKSVKQYYQDYNKFLETNDCKNFPRSSPSCHI